MAHVDQDDARHAARRSVASLVRGAAVLAGARRARARSAQKTKAGFFRKVGKDIEVLDPGGARLPASAGERRAGSRRDPRDRAAGREIREAARVAASAGAVPVGDLPRPVPLQRVPPRSRSPTTRATSTSRSAGASAGSWVRSRRGRRRAGTRSRGAIDEDIAAGKALANVPLPAWVRGEKVRAAQRRACAGGRLSRRRATRSCRAATLPVYARQLFPDPVLGERVRPRHDDLRDRRGAHVAPRRRRRASCRSRPRRTRSATTCSTACCARSTRPSAQFAGLVIWQATRAVLARREPRRARARRSQAGRWGVVEGGRREVPADGAAAALQPGADGRARCAAWRSAARASSSCTATRTVAALESYIGLVEAGVGLLPARRRQQGARAARRRRGRGAAPIGSQVDQLPVHPHVLPDGRDGDRREERARGEGARATCAPSDVVVMHAHEMLHVAIGAGARARRRRLPAAAAARATIPVAGRTGIATLEMMLVNMRDGGFISAYDFEVGLRDRARAVRRRGRRRAAWSTRLAARPRAQRVHGARCRTRARRRASRTRSPPASRCGTDGMAQDRCRTPTSSPPTRTAGRQGAARRVPHDAARHAARARAGAA